MVAAGMHASRRSNSLVITSDGGLSNNGWRVPGARDVAAVAAKGHIATWVTASGRVWTAELEQVAAAHGTETLHRTVYTEPVPVRHALGNAPVRDVAMGVNHTLLVLFDGRVLGQGSNTFGCLGRSGAVAFVATPEPIPGADVLGAAVSVSAGHYSTGIVLQTGRAYVLGMNGFGQLGLGDTSSTRSLTHLEFPSSVLQLSMNHHGVAVLRNGDLYTWGRNDCYQCGTGDTGVSYRPLLVHGGWSSRGVSSFACGVRHTVIVDMAGAAFMAGFCFMTFDHVNTVFARVHGLPKIVAVASDTSRAVFVGGDGEVYEGGVLAGGFSDVPAQLVPHPVPLPMALQASGVNLAPRAIYPAKMLAFAMGLHRRLGVDSACRVLVHDTVLRVKRAGDASGSECEDRRRGTSVQACI